MWRKKEIFKRLPYFKALTIDDRRWIEGSIIHVTKTYKGEEDERDCDIWQIVDNEGVAFNINKDTICQYIGYRDCNNNRVFENDILELSGTKHNTDTQFYVKYIIIQDLKGWKTKILKLQNYNNRTSYIYSIPHSINIGNAITDPELLEGKILKNLLERYWYKNDTLLD